MNRLTRRPGRLPFGFLALLIPAIVLTPAALLAQDAPLPDRTTMNGVVVDAVSGQPLPGASVIYIEQAAPIFTDREGRFAFREVRPGTRTLIVTQLGYDSVRIDVEFETADRPIVVPLTADPIVLERIEVLVDRLESRRRAVGTSVRVIDATALRSTSAQSALDLIRTRTGLIERPCPSRLALVPCAIVRGRVVPVQVFVDGATILSGIDMLASIPPDELYTVEIYSGGRVIHAYTTWFIESVARGRRLPVIPLL